MCIGARTAVRMASCDYSVTWYKSSPTFDLVCLDLEWKVIYVGSPESSEYDQVLDSIMVGPIPPGTNKFLFQVCVM